MVAYKDSQIFHVITTIECVSIGLSFVINFFLILAIIMSSKELGNYRFLLLAFAMNDLWFSLDHLMTFPIICSYQDAFIMFSKGILTSKFSICLFAAVFSQTMPIMAHLFLYRLIVLRWPRFSQFYTGLKTGLLVTGTVLLQLALWFANCWFNYHSDDEMQRYVKPFLDSDFPGEGEGHIGALYYNEHGLRASAVLTTMGFNAIMIFWFSIIATCAVLIVKSFNAYANQQACRTQCLQRRMFKTLLIQMAVPLLFVYFPCAGIINCPMFFRISIFPNVVSASLTIFPLIDAIITLVGVNIFRQHILAFVRKMLCLRSSGTPNASNK